MEKFNSLTAYVEFLVRVQENLCELKRRIEALHIPVVGGEGVLKELDSSTDKIENEEYAKKVESALVCYGALLRKEEDFYDAQSDALKAFNLLLEGNNDEYTK